MNKDKGFTLLELIIVMFLIGLMLSLASVFFANTLPSSKFNATAREIAATIRHARTLAQLKGERQIITIDMDEHKYGIDGLGVKHLPDGVSVKVIDPRAGEIETGKYQLGFPPTGGIEGGTIILWSSKKTATIEIDPIVGSSVIKIDAAR
jgi:general secretion pathway protein H